MEENIRVMTFRGVPKTIAEYIMGRNDYARTPIKIYTDPQGDMDLVVAVAQDRQHKVREYVRGLITGYLLANQPEGNI